MYTIKSNVIELVSHVNQNISKYRNFKSVYYFTTIQKDVELGKSYKRRFWSCCNERLCIKNNATQNCCSIGEIVLIFIYLSYNLHMQVVQCL